jgi:hypothetical protein
MTTAIPIGLEPAAQQVADAFCQPPFLSDMTPADARKVVEDAQFGPVSNVVSSREAQRAEEGLSRSGRGSTNDAP